MGIVEKLSLGLGAKLEGNSFDTQKDDKAKVKVEKRISKVVLPKNQHQLVFSIEKRNGKILRKFQRLHYPLRAVPVAGRRSAPGIHLQKSRSAFRLVRREPERCDSFR